MPIIYISYTKPTQKLSLEIHQTKNVLPLLWHKSNNFKAYGLGIDPNPLKLNILLLFPWWWGRGGGEDESLLSPPFSSGLRGRKAGLNNRIISKQGWKHP